MCRVVIEAVAVKGHLNGVRVDGNVVVVIATYASSRMHHPGYLESINHWLTYGEKQPLDLRGQLYVLEEVVTLLLNVFVKRFLLLHITLNEVNNTGETQHRGEIVEDS